MKIILIILLLTTFGCSSYVSTATEFYLNELPENEIYGDPLYKKYSEQLRSIIGSNAVKYSYSTGEGNVRLIFKLKSDGALKGYHVDLEQTTASQKTINDAVRALKKSKPLPPFPDGLSENYDVLTFEVTFSYENK